jgi:hypothetical protein
MLRCGGESRRARRERSTMKDRTDHEIRGVWTRGADPKELVLSDGSRLSLESGLSGDGEVAWRRTDGRGDTEGPVSVPEALELAGDPYRAYVSVRTRAEAEWLRAIAEWCRREATRLEGGLATAT